MTTFTLETIIHASPEACFDLARSIDFHLLTMSHSKERAVAGRTSGLIEKHESVTWEAVHFFIRQRLTSRITAFERPTRFIDEMENGPFKSLWHQHTFYRLGNTTRMVDEFKYTVPYGFAGKFFDWLLLKQYMIMLLRKRNALLKSFAESACQISEKK